MTKSNKDFALGLPSKSNVEPINQSGPTRLVVQQHKATTDHFDMRLQDGDIAHSWVVRSLPGTKDKMLAVQQPTHRADYMDWEGTIEKGYGAGKVKKVMDEDVVVTKADDKKIHIALPDTELTMVKTKYSPNSWLMIKHNPLENPVTSKPKYKAIDEPSDYSNEDKALQPKIDGAHSIFHLKSNGLNRIYSYRNRKRDNKPIEHTHQLPDIRDMEIPKELNNTVLRGEIYATKDGKPVPAEIIGGMLNASVKNSLEKQESDGKLKPYLFDIVRYNGKNMENEPYGEKLKLLREISKEIPELKAPETAITPDEKRSLVDKIKAKLHPDTEEGMVEWDLNSPTGSPKKIKLRDTHDVYIRKVFQAKDKNGTPKEEAGGFKYSWSPKGKIVGNVGTGFTREKRIDLFKSPEDYVGRIARVKAQKIFNSGAMRAPSFYSMDVEKNLMDKKAFLNELYDSAFEGELEKVAVSFSKVYSAVAKRLSQHPSGQRMSNIYKSLAEESSAKSPVRFSSSTSKLVDRMQKAFPKTGINKTALLTPTKLKSEISRELSSWFKSKSAKEELKNRLSQLSSKVKQNVLSSAEPSILHGHNMMMLEPKSYDSAQRLLKRLNLVSDKPYRVAGVGREGRMAIQNW